jgi:phosphoribosylglycinamide formyltransferase-1
MRLLKGAPLDVYENRILNIHPALLPAFPGLDVQKAAIDYGAKISGCTVHFVDEECDHGPIIIQAPVPILEGDTPDDLAARILEQEHRIYPEAVKLYFQDRLRIEGRRVRVLPE